MMRYIVFRKKTLYKLRPYISSLVVTALIFFVVMVFILDLYKIPTESMEPTLLPGDHVVGLKIVYGVKVPFTDAYIRISSPKHSDLVAIKRPEDKILYIKRVLALPTELFDLRSGNMVISGKVLKKDYATDTSIYKYSDKDAVVFEEHFFNRKYYVSYSNQKRIPDLEKPYLCSRDGYFVIGDNRTNSIDSRKWGEVKESKIIAKVIFVLFSVDPDTGKIRWGRTAKILR